MVPVIPVIQVNYWFFSKSMLPRFGCCRFYQNITQCNNIGIFAEKGVYFEASRAIFWSVPGYRDLKLTKKLFSDRALRGLLFEMQLIRFQSSGMRRKHSCEMLCKIIPLFFRFFSPVFVLFGGF